MRFKLLSLAALALLVVSSHGQSPLGALEGIVTDSTMAAIPGAKVTLTHLTTNAERSTVTDSAGRYAFAALQVGPYRLRVGSEGFNSVERQVDVAAGQVARVSVVLEIGAVTETIVLPAGRRRKFEAMAPPPAHKPAPGYGNAQIRVSGDAHGVFGNQTWWSAGPQRSESYAHIAENRFLSTAKSPLSTFSIDVDTASYSNVRRFLHDGKLPPPDAVRVEELINYFRYDDPDPPAGQPFSVSAEVAACPWNTNNKLVRIGLRSTPIQAADLPAANLVFLLDVSGSMSSAAKLPLLKKAFALLVDQLRPQDRVAIAVYAGAAGLVLPSTPGSQKDKILGALDSLRAGGSTAGAAGIRLAYETAQKNFLPQGNNRVILATDGDFNVGVASESELIRLIEAKRDKGIFLTVLGFGTGNIQDDKMESIADHGNGQYGYVDSMLEARRQLVEQIGATLLTVAKDVKIQVEFNPKRVKEYRLVGYENRLLAAEDFDDDTKDAGEMGAGHVVTALYEIVPGKAEGADLRYQTRKENGGREQSDELLFVKVRYKDPDADESRLLVEPLLDRDRPIEDASANLRFAAAVAEFGMLLRDSEHKGDANFEQAARLADSARGEDADGRRTELVFLAKTAAGLAKANPLETASR